MSDRGIQRIPLRGALPLYLALICPIDATALEDPTRPPAQMLSLQTPAAEERTTIQWRLSSVLISADRRLAVVNGERVNRGDTVSGARVESIEPGRVTLTSNGQKIILTLLPKLAKRTTSPADNTP